MAGDEVFAWLMSQPAWQQDLARRLAVRVDLDGDAYDDALRMVKMQHAVPSDRAAPSVQPISRGDLPEPAAGPTTRLLRFGRLQVQLGGRHRCGLERQKGGRSRHGSHLTRGDPTAGPDPARRQRGQAPGPHRR